MTAIGMMVLSSPAAAFMPARPSTTLCSSRDGSKQLLPPYDAPKDLGLDFLSTVIKKRNVLQSSFAQPPPIAWVYLGGLALQFGVQPILTKKFTSAGVIRSTVILAQDFVRFCTCWLMLVLSGSWKSSMQQWTLRAALLGAGIPSILYTIQNYFALIAYQTLPPVTFNVLNQTKTLSAALSCYLILGRKQSAIQFMALLLLILSSLVIENILPIPGKSGKDSFRSDPAVSAADFSSDADKKYLNAGVAPVLMASFISGLGKSVNK